MKSDITHTTIHPMESNEPMTLAAPTRNNKDRPLNND